MGVNQMSTGKIEVSRWEFQWRECSAHSLWKVNLIKLRVKWVLISFIVTTLNGDKETNTFRMFYKDIVFTSTYYWNDVEKYIIDNQEHIIKFFNSSVEHSITAEIEKMFNPFSDIATSIGKYPLPDVRDLLLMKVLWAYSDGMISLIEQIESPTVKEKTSWLIDSIKNLFTVKESKIKKVIPKITNKWSIKSRCSINIW